LAYVDEPCPLPPLLRFPPSRFAALQLEISFLTNRATRCLAM